MVEYYSHSDEDTLFDDDAIGQIKLSGLINSTRLLDPTSPVTFTLVTVIGLYSYRSQPFILEVVSKVCALQYYDV